MRSINVQSIKRKGEVGAVTHMEVLGGSADSDDLFILYC